MVRLGGVAVGAVAVISFLLSRYGLKGLFSASLWRLLAVLACFILSFFGGFRSILIMIMLLVVFQGMLEGVFKSRWMPIVALAGVLLIAVGIPFVSKLPQTFQRVLSVIPSLDVSQEAREGARASTEWRIKIWQEILPEVPQYLLLGKGFSMNSEEWAQANFSESFGSSGAVVAGDYHSGPLSVVIPLGIWGAIGFLWLLWSGGRLLYLNFRYGDPALKTINTFLLAAFITETVLFVFVFGSFYSDLIKFTSLLGFSVALNGGRCRPTPAPAHQPMIIKLRVPLKPAPTPGVSRQAGA